MEIVTAKKEDLEIVRKITRSTIKSIYPRYYPAGAVEFFLAHHSDEHIVTDISDNKVFVLYEGGEPVGTVTIKDNNINRLFVLPDYQHKGYGKALLDFAEKKILELYECVQIDASFPAKRIYLKRGYKEIEYNIIKTDNGDCLCYYVMRLEKNMVREAEQSDLDAILELYLFLHEDNIPEKDEHLRDTWLQIIQDTNHHLIVNELGGKIVSSCVCVIIPNLTRNIRPYAFIENVVTRKDYRGKGYASECLEFAREIAEKENCYKMMLLTGSKKPETLRFYEKCGYNSSDKTAFIQWLGMEK